MRARNASAAERSLGDVRQGDGTRPDNAEFHSNFVYTICFHPDYGPEAILGESRRWADKFESPLQAQRWIRTTTIAIPIGAEDRSMCRRISAGTPPGEFSASAALESQSAKRRRLLLRQRQTPRRHDVPMQHLSPHWRDCMAMSDVDMAEVCAGRHRYPGRSDASHGRQPAAGFCPQAGAGAGDAGWAIRARPGLSASTTG